MQIRKIITALVTCATVAMPVAAQTTTAAPPADTGAAKVAYIVAVVGDSVITSAFMVDALQRHVNELQQAGAPQPSEEVLKAYADTALNQHIADLVILQVIARDTSYKVNDEALSSAVESNYNETQAKAGGPVEFTRRLKESGLTPQGYRAQLASQLRTRELYKQFKDRMQQKRVAPKASQKEIEALFPEWSAARGPRPAMVSFQQIKVRVEPSDSALARAKAKADSIYQVVIKDRDKFAELARKFSDDTGTKEKGGEFGYFKQDEVAKEFGRAAFNSPVGTITPPVRTEFGYHIIDVERHRGQQVQARHILISAEVTPADVARAQARADSAAAKLRAGGDIHEIIKQFGDTQEDLTLSGQDPAAISANLGIDLSKASKGDIVGPGSTAPGPGQFFTIARVTDVSPAGAWGLNDPGVRDAIRNYIESQKLLDEVVAELKRDMYIEIRPH